MKTELFALSTRRKHRFSTPQGLISTEDLWDLGMPALDKIARGLHAMANTEPQFSLLGTVDPAVAEARLKLEVVTEVFNTLKAEAEQRRLNEAAQQEIQRLEELVHRKREADLADLSVEQLQQKLDEARAKASAGV